MFIRRRSNNANDIVQKFVDHKNINYLTSATCFDSLGIFRGYHSTTSLCTLLAELFDTNGAHCHRVIRKYYLRVFGEQLEKGFM